MKDSNAKTKAKHNTRFSVIKVELVSTNPELTMELK